MGSGVDWDSLYYLEDLLKLPCLSFLVRKGLEGLNKRPSSPKLAIVGGDVVMPVWLSPGFVQIPLLSLNGCVTSVKWFSLAKSQFPDL